jgi:peptidyl-prolyl cis-trans isomerase SurA
MLYSTIKKTLLAFLFNGTLVGIVTAQSLFDPVVSINGSVITEYELNQRVQFNHFLEQTGKNIGKAREDLINDRLKVSAGRRAGIELSQDNLEHSMVDFANNSSRSLEELLNLIAQNGVDAQTFRDFVKSGVIWRKLVRSQFAGRGLPSEAEIDRAIASVGPQGGLRVLMSEIVIAASPQQAVTAKRLADKLSKITSITEFSQKATEFSAAPTRVNGGKLEWTTLNDLPAALAPIVAALRPGQVTPPLNIPNAIVLLQLRAVEETAATAKILVKIEYAFLSGPTTSIQIAAKNSDTCDDLYGLVKSKPELKLSIQSQKPSDIKRDKAVRIALLDKDEKSILPTAEEKISDMVMLCKRVYAISENASRAEITQNLRLARLNSLADGYLAELRANADIVDY